MNEVKIKPLTKDELLALKGKPYYHYSLLSNEEKWKILNEDIEEKFDKSHYQILWLAFNRKVFLKNKHFYSDNNEIFINN